MKFELPEALNGWRIAPITEIFDFNSETLPSSTRNDYEFDYLPLETVSTERIDWNAVQRLKFRDCPSRARRLVKEGDLLISTVRPNLQGFVEFRGVGDGPYIASTGFSVLRARNGHNPSFYLAQLLSDFGAAQFHSLVSGTNYPAIANRDFERIQLLVPGNPKEAQAISIALKLLGGHIAATQKAIVSAEHLQNGLMWELLSGRITADGTVRLESEFVDDGRGALPRTWTRARIKDFGEVSTGKTPPTEVAAHFLGEIPFITPGDMGNTKWLSKSERSLSDSGAKLVGKLPPKTVCVVCIGATIGKVGLTDRTSATNQQINSITCANHHSPEYLYYALRFFARHIAAIAGVNATPQLNKSEFSKVRIPMPADSEEEAAIAQRLSELDDLLEAKRAKITALQHLKKSLIQNLLTGRMRLSPEAIAELAERFEDEKVATRDRAATP